WSLACEGGEGRGVQGAGAPWTGSPGGGGSDSHRLRGFAAGRVGAVVLADDLVAGVPLHRAEPRVPDQLQQVLPPQLVRRAEVVRVVREDRKSTRLKSSHVKISYAVFCLKKKKRRNR